MTKRGEKIAARARSMVGVRFRPQGRSPETGLDCIGLVALAAGVRGARADYSLHGGRIDELNEELARAGLKTVCRSVPGDVLVFQSGFEQLHLGIKTSGGFVHAHAGLRRVVETPGEPEWPVLKIWRGPMRRRAAQPKRSG